MELNFSEACIEKVNKMDALRDSMLNDKLLEFCSMVGLKAELKRFAVFTLRNIVHDYEYSSFTDTLSAFITDFVKNNK